MGGTVSGQYQMSLTKGDCNEPLLVQSCVQANSPATSLGGMFLKLSRRQSPLPAPSLFFTQDETLSNPHLETGDSSGVWETETAQEGRSHGGTQAARARVSKKKRRQTDLPQWASSLRLS